MTIRFSRTAVHPGPKQQELSRADQKRLAAIVAEIDHVKARLPVDGELLEERWQQFAVLVRELGVTASARAMGVTSSAMSQRISGIEKRAGGGSG